MFGWRLEFSDGKNVTVPLEDVITDDKYSLGEDSKKASIFSVCKGYIYWAITQSGRVQPLNTTVQG